MNLWKALFGSVAGLLFATSAQAQVNHVPQVGEISNIVRIPTYTASTVSVAPASAATDVMCIAASATRGISIRRIAIGGTAGTAITTPVLIYRRATVDTGGTPGTGLILPVPVPHSSVDPASTATLVSYTANPTVTDASPLLEDVFIIDLPVTTAAGGNVETMHTYGSGGVDTFEKGIDLAKNTTQQVCANLNGATVATGVVSITFEWQEQ